MQARAMHGRRGGALSRLVSQRGWLWGGPSLCAASARHHDRADLPRGLSLRGRPSADLERSTGCHLGFQG